MSKLFQDFLSLKWNRINPRSSTEETITEREKVVEVKEIRSLDDLHTYMLSSIHKAIVRARYMEIITGYSNNIKASISDSYDDVIQAILAEPNEDLEKDKIAMSILEPVALAQTEDALKSRKLPNELKCDEIIARTWMGIDGDIVMLLPTTGRIDPELLALHKANVDVSVQNWRYLLDTIVRGIAIITDVAGSQQSSSPRK